MIFKKHINYFFCVCYSAPFVCLIAFAPKPPHLITAVQRLSSRGDFVPGNILQRLERALVAMGVVGS